MTNESSKSTVKTITKTPTKKSPQKGVLFFSLLFALLAIFGVLFLWQQDLTKTNQIKAIEAQLTTLTKANNAQTKTQSTVQQTLAQIQAQKSTPAMNQNWNVAGYLLHLANVEYTLLHRPKRAQALLVAASDTLKNDMVAPSSVLKPAIQRDITTLNQSTSVAVTAQLSKIDTLSQQVATLSSEPQKQFHPLMSKPHKEAGAWQNIKYNLKNFENLVVIRHTDQPIQPLLTPEDFESLKAAVRLQLGLAQWALVSQQAAAYQAALQNAASWLTQYANQNNAAQQIAQQLKALSQQPLTTPPVDSLPSWETWKKLNNKEG